MSGTRQIISTLANIFRKAEQSLAENRFVGKNVAEFIAAGGRGTFQSISRGAAKDALKYYISKHYDHLNKDTKDLIMDIADINLRAVQQYYNEHDKHVEKRKTVSSNSEWIKDHVYEIGEAYVRAIERYGKSSIYNDFFETQIRQNPRLSTYAPDKNTYLYEAIKQYGFTALDMTWKNIGEHDSRIA